MARKNKPSLTELERLYWNDPEKAKRLYEAERNAASADADEWEQNLQRGQADSSPAENDSQPR
jgi:hypothetical protein